jgi:hypothetical protein
MGFVDKVAFKNARTMVFFEIRQAGNNFWSGTEILNFLVGRLSSALMAI